MRLQVILLILCGGALDHALTLELEALSEVAPVEDAGDLVREKRQWYPGNYNPNPYGDFYPRTWWDNNYANYAPVGGRSGYQPSASFGNPYEYFGQMHEFYNSLPDVRNTGSRSNSLPILLLTHLHKNSYLPPMKQSDTETLQRSWQQFFQQMGHNFGSQGGVFPQQNNQFGQGPGSSLGSHRSSPFGNNSGRPFREISGSNFGGNSGTSGTGNSFGSGSSFGTGSSSDSFRSNSFGTGASSDPFGSSGNSNDHFDGNSGTGNSFGSGSSFGTGSSSDSFGSNSFGAGASADPFGSSGNSNDPFGMDSSQSSDPFKTSNLVKKSTDNNVASPAVAAEFTT